MRATRRRRLLERLFELYEQEMYRIAYAILHDEGQAEDAVMAAFERIVRNEGLPARADSSDARRLCRTIVKSCAIDQYRKNARTREHETFDELAIQLAADRQEPHDAASDLWALVDTLPISYRRVIVERFANELTVKETAEKLGISEGSVRTRQHRAISEIRMRKECLS